MVLLLFLIISTAAAEHLDPHFVLGVQAGAGEAEIRRAYRAAALVNHPDKNSSAAAQAQFLLLQQAYEALRPGGSGSGNQFNRHSQRQQEQEQQRTAWQRFWQQPRPPQHISSKTEELGSTSFYRRVLLSNPSSSNNGGGSDSSQGGVGGTAGLPWLIQMYSDASPYCRVLSTHWEAAATELDGLVQLGRINIATHPMLVRFLASQMRLFSGPDPSHELPVAFGLPAGCFSTACARVFRGTFSAAGLQHFAAEHLLRLPPLPLISPQLLAAWRRAAAAREPAGTGVALLALLPQGPQPLKLLAAVTGARLRLSAVAAAVWRPSDRALWVGAVGAASAPALVFWQGGAEWPSAIVHSSLLSNSTDWAAALERHAQPAVPLLTPATALQQLGACSLSSGVAEAPHGALCVLLLGQGARLAAAQAGLQSLHGELSTGGSGGGSAEQRTAGSLLVGGMLQLAWADGGQQRALCRHLLLWSGAPPRSSGVCEPWWRHRLASLLGRGRQLLQPSLVAYRQRQPSGAGGQLVVGAFQGSLKDREELVAWLAALGDAGERGRLLRPAPPLNVPLAHPASTWPALAALLLQALHLASRAELLWRQAAAAVGAAARRVDWRRVAQLGLAGGALLGLKWVLDLLSGSEDDVGCSFDASPKKERLGQLHPGSALSGSSVIDRVREMQQSDREPSDGRLLVVLPLHADGGSQQAQQAQRAKQQFALLAAVFRNEPRLAFRLAPVSGTLLSLLDDGSSSCGNSSAGSEVGQQPGQQGQQQQLGPLAQAIILHPQLARRFQLLRLPGVRQAVARLEEVLDGGGHWHQGG